MKEEMKKRIEELYEIEYTYRKAEHQIKLREARLHIHTDFKEQGCTNQKMRESYVYDKLSTALTDKKKGLICPSLETLKELEADYHYQLRLYELEKDLMKQEINKEALKELEMDISKIRHET